MNKNRSFAVTSQAAVDIWNQGVEAAGAEAVVGNLIQISANSLSIASQKYELQRLKKIVVIGFGKCSGAMAAGFESAVKDLPGIELSGLVIVPAGQSAATARIETVVGRPEASNFPTATVVAQTQRMLDMITEAAEDTLIVAMVSGGGSALLERPLVPLEELVSVSRALSGRGAPIESLNTLRRAISGVKAGGLARHLLEHSTAQMIGLIISDVIGDSLAMVASGPTVISEQSVSRLRSAARDVMLQFDLQDTHDSIYRWLGQKPTSRDATIAGAVKTSKTNERCETCAELDGFGDSNGRVKNFLIANNKTAVDAAKVKSRDMNFKLALTDDININQDVNDVAEAWVELANRALAASGKIAMVAGGEPTVVLCDSPGRGGRNLQLTALVLQLLAKDWPVEEAEVAFLAGGTDGEDGSAGVAGAFFDTEMVGRLQQSPALQKALEKAILTNDCDDFFNRHGHRLSSPVATNVCDLHVMLARRLGQEA